MKRHLLVVVAAAMACSTLSSSPIGAATAKPATPGQDFIEVTDQTIPDGTVAAPLDDVTDYSLGAHNEKTDLPVSGSLATSGAQSNSQIFKGGRQSEAGCSTHIVTVQYVTVYIVLHVTHWEYHESVHYCWHWKSYHRVDYPGCSPQCQPISAYGWWDHVELGWKVQGQCQTIDSGTGNQTTCQHAPFPYEGGYTHSGQDVLQRAEILACIEPTCSFPVTWYARADFHVHDDSTWISFADVQ